MKELNFKDWLEEQGVNTKLFWKNCKKKYQKFDRVWDNKPRKYLGKQRPSEWINYAFDWEGSIAKNSYSYWSKIDTRWYSALEIAKHDGAKVVFGFKNKKESK